MYCHHCGQKAIGRFCSNCGTKLVQGDQAPDDEASSDEPNEPAVVIPDILKQSIAQAAGDPATAQALDAVSSGSIDWREEVDVDKIRRHPEVVALVNHHSLGAERKMTGEEFLKAWDENYGQIIPGVDSTTFTKAITSIAGKLGIKCSKQVSLQLPVSFAEAIVAALCSFARRSQTIQHIQQDEGGCLMVVQSNASMFTWKVNLSAYLTRDASGVMVNADSTIHGQLFDWGRNQTVLDEFFNDLSQFR